MNSNDEPTETSSTSDQVTSQLNASQKTSPAASENLHVLKDSISSPDDYESEDEFEEGEMTHAVDEMNDDDDLDENISLSRSLDSFKNKFEQFMSDDSLMEMMSEFDVLTLEECAVYLKIKFGDVRRLVKEQGLPGRKIGEEWRFLRGAVAEWLANPDMFESTSEFADETRFEEAPRRPKRKKHDRREDRERFDEMETQFVDGDQPPRRDTHRPSNQRRRRYGNDQELPASGQEQSRHRRDHSSEADFIEGENRSNRRFRESRESQSGAPRSSGGSRPPRVSKKPRREALNSQRFKRLDRRRFGDDQSAE